jgi:hypothetical protein
VCIFVPSSQLGAVIANPRPSPSRTKSGSTRLLLGTDLQKQAEDRASFHGNVKIARAHAPPSLQYNVRTTECRGVGALRDPLGARGPARPYPQLDPSLPTRELALLAQTLAALPPHPEAFASSVCLPCLPCLPVTARVVPFIQRLTREKKLGGHGGGRGGEHVGTDASCTRFNGYITTHCRTRGARVLGLFIVHLSRRI